MKEQVKIVFGEEPVRKLFANQFLTDEEQNQSVKTFLFRTKEEKAAFLKGIEAAVGWTNFCIPEIEFDTERPLLKK